MHFSRELGAQCLVHVYGRANLPRRWRASGALTRPGTIRQQMRELGMARACDLMVPKHAYEILRFREFFHFRASAARDAPAPRLSAFPKVCKQPAITGCSWRLDELQNFLRGNIKKSLSFFANLSFCRSALRVPDIKIYVYTYIFARTSLHFAYFEKEHKNTSHLILAIFYSLIQMLACIHIEHMQIFLQ